MSLESSVPLNKLFLSPLNQRQTPKDADVSDLEASIGNGQLLQRLVVHKAGKGEMKGGYGVCAGGRRFRALCNLATAGKIGPTAPVDVLVITRDEAIAASLAENTQRKDMHPVEQFRAFRTLIDSRKSVEDVAAAFGVTPAVVRRQLRLADVSPALLDAALRDEISIEQLMALSVVEDHGLQEQVWESAPHYERTADALRRRLTQGERKADEDRRMHFVGIEAYQAAGGRLRVDLFAEHSGYIMDGVLLDQLARDKMQETVEQFRVKGWTHIVTVVGEQPFHVHSDTVQVSPARRDLTETEQADYDAAERRVNEIDEQSQTLADQEEGDEESEAQITARIAERDAERDALVERMDLIDTATQSFSIEQMQQAGVVVYLQSNGQIGAAEGAVLTEDDDAVARIGTLRKNTGQRTGSLGNEEAPAEKAAHSERLTSQLTAHRTMAAMLLTAQQPRMGLIAALQRMLPATFGWHGCYHMGQATLRSESKVGHLLTLGDDLKTSPAYEQLRLLQEDWQSKLADVARSIEQDDDDAQPLAWLLQQDDYTLLSLFAFCTAVSLDLVATRTQTPIASAYTDALGLDMAQWWTPTADAYFKHVAKPQIVAAVTEATGEKADKLGSLKKDAAASAAQAAVANTGWLPPMLRRA